MKLIQALDILWKFDYALEGRLRFCSEHDSDVEEVKYTKLFDDVEIDPDVFEAARVWDSYKTELNGEDIYTNNKHLYAPLYYGLMTDEEKTWESLVDIALRCKHAATYVLEAISPHAPQKLNELIQNTSFEKDWYYLFASDDYGDWKCYFSSPMKSYVRKCSENLDDISERQIWSNGYACEWW